jgi:hypothetical protein
MTNIYVLKLEQNKYYIGKTNNINIRLNDHMSGNGSQWTKKYKPIEITEVIPNCDDFDEDKYTKIYMNKFGIYNVRGGSYTKIVLSKEEISLLEKEITGSTDKCYNCNKPGHFSKECNLLEEENEDYESESNFEKENVLPVKNNSIFNIFTSAIQTFSNIVSEFDKANRNVCYRCGRDTHFANKCYAKTHINGYRL